MIEDKLIGRNPISVIGRMLYAFKTKLAAYVLLIKISAAVNTKVMESSLFRMLISGGGIDRR